MLRLLIFICCVGVAQAGEIAPDSPRDGDIPVAEWREMSAGRTLTYFIDGAFFALEHYSKSGDGVMLQLADGRCLSGRWDHRDTQYCYYWDGADGVCFRHVRMGSEILILQLDNGVETGDMQNMVGVSDAPLVCGGLVS